MVYGSCYYCKHLDRSRKQYSEDKYCFRYGCNSRDLFVCGVIISSYTDNQRDEELKNQGCSDFEERKENEQLSLF